MFTGIVESISELLSVRQRGSNAHLTFRSALSRDLKVDQSLSHNGVCLTVVCASDSEYEVVVIKETLERTNLSALRPGDLVNLERSLRLGDRIDGHMVQGHIDTTVPCLSVECLDGSWKCSFDVSPPFGLGLIVKGSVALNGVSLTVVDCNERFFSVMLIPYTFEHTTFSTLKPGDAVNVEFDLFGKYIQKYLEGTEPRKK